MENLMSRIIWMSEKIKELFRENKELKAKLGKTSLPPYSKVKKQPKFNNMDLVFDGTTGIWHSYAIFKDDEE